MKNTTSILLALLFAILANCSSAFARDSKTEMTEVKGYTKKDGTVVKGYTRTKKSKTEPEMTQVSGYTKKDGTVVKGYSRKKPTKIQ